MNDLIYRSAAIAEIDEYLHGLDSCISEPDLKLDGYKNGLQVAIEELRELPAVDAAPVVHARWKSVKAGASNNYPFWDSKCSECGYTTAMTQTGWLYCPHCGAKMQE